MILNKNNFYKHICFSILFANIINGFSVLQWLPCIFLHIVRIRRISQKWTNVRGVSITEKVSSLKVGRFCDRHFQGSVKSILKSILEVLSFCLPIVAILHALAQFLRTPRQCRSFNKIRSVSESLSLSLSSGFPYQRGKFTMWRVVDSRRFLTRSRNGTERRWTFPNEGKMAREGAGYAQRYAPDRLGIRERFKRE